MRPGARLFLVGLALALFALALASAAAAGTWNETTPSGSAPAPGYSQTSPAYDAAGDNLIFFSIDDGTPLPRPTDTWVLEDATSFAPSWTLLSTSGGPPLGRYAHSVVYAPTSNSLIVYGGCPANCSLALADTWVLSNANGTGGTPTWSQLSTSGLNSEGHSAVYDDANNRMIVFGGQQGFNFPNNSVRVLANADGTGGAPSWTTLAPLGVPPAPRETVGAAYDAANNRMIVFGGATLQCCASVAATYNDVWVLTNANGLGGTPAWSLLTPTGTPPPPRYWTSAVYDAPTNRLLIFGGVDGQANSTDPHYNDVWALSNANGLGGTPAWGLLTPSGTPPAGRFAQIAAYNETTKRLVVTLGRTDTPSFELFNDVWLLSEDETAPTITIATPADDATYLLGASVLADYECADEAGGSGLASCVGTVADGAALDTTSAGDYDFTVAAADNAGNTSSLTHTYYVTYDFDGFAAPIDNSGLNIVKAGQVVPLRWRLLDADGDPFTDLAAVKITVKSLACDTETTSDAVEEVASGSSGLQNLGDGYYQYNWKSLKSYANSCKTMQLDLFEGSVASPIYHTAAFKFKK